MLDALDIQPTDFVLDIGMGLGYSAAVLSQLGEAVVAVEDDQTRFDEASEALGDFGADNVIPHLGELAAGAAEHGPYDVILIQGGLNTYPIRCWHSEGWWQNRMSFRRRRAWDR